MSDSFRRLLAFALLGCCAAVYAQTPGAAPIALEAPDSPRIVHAAASEFNRRVLVVDAYGYRSMRFGSEESEDQTRIHPGHPEQLPMPYLRSAAVGLAVPETLERLLMIGLGGGAFASYVRVKLPDTHIDAVEIDPAVARIARDYFALSEGPTLQVHVQDAVEYVRRTHAPFDYILLDAYDADDLPEPLIASSFFRDLRKNLAEGGVAVANIAIGDNRRTRYIIRKLTTHFDHCLHMVSTPSFNDVLLLSDQPLPGKAQLKDWAADFEPDTDAGLGMQTHIESARPCLQPAQ